VKGTDEVELPDNLEAEKFVLGGCIAEGESTYLKVAAVLKAADFALEKHKRIFLRMSDLHERHEKIDRVTVANELINHGQLQSVDGLSYLVSLDDGLPHLENLEAYATIVKECSLLRSVARISEQTRDLACARSDDAREIAGRAARRLIEISTSGKDSTALQSMGEIVNDLGPTTILDPSKRPRGLQTGFRRIDEKTGGLRGGELIIVAARPNMGKSAFAGCLAEHCCAPPKGKPKTAAFFSLEMSKESLLTRMMCSHARVDQLRYRAGYLGAEERNRLQNSLTEISTWPLHIDDTADLSMLNLESKIMKLIPDLETELGLVVVDYLQLMHGGDGRNRVQEISQITRFFKILSGELRVPFLVLSQLSRAPETRPGDHRPMLSDLRESGSIEQDADMVAFIFREEVYRPDKESLKGLAELICAKQRNGPTFKAKLAFLKQCTRFEDLADPGYDEPPHEWEPKGAGSYTEVEEPEDEPQENLWGESIQ
jgi:replicative DNA helicase